MGALEGGDEAQAKFKNFYMNVQESMRNRALRVSSTSFDISKELKKRNEDLSGDSAYQMKNHNVVRIMTIHKMQRS